MTVQEILAVIEADERMMRALREAAGLGLPNWAIGAGFVRNKVWDVLHGQTGSEAGGTDIDLTYFDPDHTDREADAETSRQLSERTGMEWEVVNQVYAHVWNDLPPYGTMENAIAAWPETATAVAVRLLPEGGLELIAPHGIDDLTNLVVRPTPAFAARKEFILNRVATKRWLEKWPRLTVIV
jgi:hypothetical protein